MGFESVIEIGVAAVGAYLLVGIVFALFFVNRGAARIDPTAREGTRGFKLLIFPGSAVFWPLLARRWWSGRSEPPEECSPHRKAAGGCGRGRSKP